MVVVVYIRKPSRPANEELPNPPGYYSMPNSKKKFDAEPPDPKLFEKVELFFRNLL